MTELCDKSAVELRGLIGAREVSPLEVVESCLRRIEAVNGKVNAFVALDAERALETAREQERQLVSSGEAPALVGLPVGVKDLAATAGLRTTYGSLLYKDNVPDKDDGQIARLRRAGAIILGKTNTPEFGSGTNTTNRVYGPTRSPFDLARTPGGSSGGSAAALACSMVPLCTGSDTGGSLRCPATWSGVVGFRPRPGAVANERRLLPHTHFSVQGPMARSVGDAALLYSVQAGAKEPLDPMALSFSTGRVAFPTPGDLSRLRVAFSEDLGAAPVDDGIRRVFRTLTAKFRPAFAHARDDHPDITGAREAFWVLRCVYYMASHRERVEDHRDLLSPTVVSNTEAGHGMSLRDVADAEVTWRNVYNRFQTFMEDVDLLILPGNSTPPYEVDKGQPKEINGRPLETYMDASLIRSAVTLAGNPVIAIPCGYDETGAPFGIQVVGRRHGAHALLRAAVALEALFKEDPDLARPTPDLEKLR